MTTTLPPTLVALQLHIPTLMQAYQLLGLQEYCALA